MCNKNVSPVHWLIAVVNEEAIKLASIDVQGLANGKVNEDEAIRISPLFWSTIRGLLTLMQHKPGQGKPSKKQNNPEVTNRTSSTPASNVLSERTSLPASNTKPHKRPPPSSIITTTPTKRLRGLGHTPPSPAEPRTPDQPTQSADPTLSAGTDVSNATAASGESIESQDEETTKKVVNQFLLGVQAVLGTSFKQLRWRGEAVRDVVIEESGGGGARIRLGNESVNAINDGGLAIVYKPEGGKAIPWPSPSTPPVLSFEVSSSDAIY